MSLKAITILPGAVKGNLTANASKSMMQRVVAASTLCDQKVTIHNPGQSHDCKAALEIARKLGAEIISGDPLSIEPRKGQIPRRVSCGESGLGIRMFTPILSLQNQSITIDGEGSLKTRPMGFFEEVLPQLGVSVESNNQKVPITIHGPLQGGDFELDGSLTSQFLTGLLMALPCAESSSTIRVKNLRSKGYVELTLQVLSSFGVIIDHENWEVFHVPGNQSYQSNAITIEGDWSGAAFLLVAGAIAGEVSLSSLVVNSFQPDKAILSALISSGARLKVGDIVSTFKSELEAFSFDATDCPDLFPPLAALAANCDGKSTIKGISRLTHKESNRALTIQSELAKVGITVQLLDDDMIIEGGQIQGGTIDSHNDHRIAMMGAILALNAINPITISNSEAINKSYPYFYEHLRALGVKTEEC